MTQWTAPRTWVHAEQPPASTWNTHVRDNLLHLKENIATASGFFRGLVMRTSYNADEASNKIILQRLDQAALDSGIGVADWSLLTLDMTASGANGIDTGSEAASTWYEIYGIHNSTSGTTALLAHRALDNFKDEDYNPTDDTYNEIRNSTPGHTAIGQGFKVDTTGYCPYVDVKVVKISSPSGQIWAEIYADSGGVPTGPALATSDKMTVDNITSAGNGTRIRFIFRSPVSLTATTQYHLVMTGNWTASDVNRIAWRSLTGGGYSNGAPSKLVGGTWSTNGANDQSFALYITRNDTSVTMPSGYDGKILLGYAYNNASSNLVAFIARDRNVMPLVGQDIGSPSGSGTVPILVDMSAYVPPVPLEFTFWCRSGAAASWDIRIGPVPDGFELTPGQRAGGETRYDATISGSTASVGQRMEAIYTETQGLYVRAGAGTIDALIVSSWIW